MIDPIKPFAFMIISALMGAFALTALFFVLWIIALIHNGINK